jgi:fibronectin-binding autotransporter adhesin
MAVGTRKRRSVSFKPGSWLTFLLTTSALTGVPDRAISQTVIDGTVPSVQNNVGNTVDLTATGSVTGLFNNQGTATIAGNVGTLVNQSTGIVTFYGSMTVGSGGFENSGTATVLSGVTVTGETTVSDGTVTVEVGGVLDGDVEVEPSGTLDLDGEITGTLDNSGDATIAGNVGTLVNLTAGNITFDGSMTVGGGGFENFGTATILTGITVTADTTVSGGTVTVNTGGTLVGPVDILAGTFDVDGTVIGNVTNSGDVDLTGTVTGDMTNDAGGELTMTGAITGTLTNTGEATIAGSLGAMDNEAGGEATFDGVTTIAGVLDNAGEATLAGTILVASGGINNQAGATFLMQGSSMVTGGLTNAGTLAVDGAATVEGLNSTGVIDLSTDGDADDTLMLLGTTTLGSTINLDIDLSGATTAADRITVASALTGDVVLSFNNTESTFGSLVTGGITVLTFGAGSGLLATSVGLEGRGAIAYRLEVDNTLGTAVVKSFTNPGVGALAGSITLTQSLIGSVINRPSSPFVTGLAVTDQQPCHPGVWARALGGRADASGTTRAIDSGGDVLVYDSLIKSSYSGIQLGGDISCFDGHFAGWDMSFGGILGVNTGSTHQPVFGINPNTGAAIPGIIVSNNSTDFQQGYVGVYMSAVKGPVLLDLQYRLEKTTFDLSNDGEGGDRIGVLDQRFDSSARTLSGSMSYVIPLNSDKGINFVPTVGFAITKSKTDAVAFDEGGRLEIDDASTEVGFIGAALSKSRVLPSGKAALTYFVTGTYYKDFADPTRSVYFDGEGVGAESFSSNLGEYGEASIGLNYTQILEPGNAVLNAKQLNASIRLDGRFGETLDSWGVTAQMRLQF